MKPPASTGDARNGLARSCRRILGYAASDGIPRRSLKVAIVVGSILNVINQGDALMGAHAVSWVKLVLTFLVPYGVSTYASVAYKLNRPTAPPAAPEPPSPDRQRA
jgi:hypothetical protein